MSRLRPFDRWVRRTLLLALALATLAPGVSHALRHQRGDTMPWSLLCSATGAKRLVFESPVGDDGAIAATHTFERCSACALQHDALAPPTPSTAASLRGDLVQAVARLSLRAPRPLPAWHLAPSRAPPPRT